MTTEYDIKKLNREAKWAAQSDAAFLQHTAIVPIVRHVAWILLIGGQDTCLRVTYTTLGDGDLLHTTSVAI